MEKEYTIGLDIGTHSVGWAVIDENKNIAKKFGHHLWGVRLFDESSDAKSRRNNRCGRRRYQRRKERIILLQKLFESEIQKVDKNFFIRLEDSFFLPKDSRCETKNIFENYLSNSEYNKKYGPTIWHLRKYLIDHPDEKIDIRLLYLAIHHIVKYRGNFLSQGVEFNIKDSSTLLGCIEKFNECIRNQREAFCNILTSDEIDNVLDYLKEIENPSINLVYKIEEIINESTLKIDGVNIENRTKTDKKRNLNKLLNTKGTVGEILFVDLLISGKINFTSLKIFKNRNEKPDVKIDFSSENFDELINGAIHDFPTVFNLLSATLSVKEMVDRFYLKKLIGENQYISYAMVQKFNQYKNDLAIIKKLFKKYLPDKYNSYFKELTKNNYSYYTGFTNLKNKKQKEKVKRISDEDFFKELRSNLNLIKEVAINENKNNEDLILINEVISRIDNNEFLQRIRSKHNGALPYQLHLAELQTIIKNQSKFYPFLNEGEPSCKEKIMSLLTFKRPYFIGPISGHGENKWSIFKRGKEEERAYPWNFEDIIDYDASAEEFIRRMQNKCTYLKGSEDYCVPKFSILYQAYNVLNYINKIKVNGVSIDKESKQRVFDLFLKNKSVTTKKIKIAINPKNPETVVVSDCNVDLASFVIFNENIPELQGKIEEYIDFVEELIKNITLFEDKTMLEKRIRNIAKEYSFILSEESIKKIKGFNFKGYGRLSRKLLNELEFSNTETGEVYRGVLKVLYETSLNFNEVYFSKTYKFKESIDKYNKENAQIFEFVDKNELLLNYIKNNLFVSPIWIRPFVQAFKIIDEVETILNTKIKYFVVECTREENVKDKKKIVQSRKSQMSDLYKSANNFKNELGEFNVNLKLLSSTLKSKDNLNQTKLLLYFQQLGKDIYTLEDIDIEELETKYDIDHIYPQSLIKDDSISNKVLTSKFKNNYKQNMLLPNLAANGFLNPKAYRFYKLLYDCKMISKTKYERLTEKEVNETAINSFVARQLTATDQAVSALIDALKNLKGVNEKNIIFSKAKIIADFRNKNYLYKSREANNFHHAHDAYLNAVIGKSLNAYFNGIGAFIDNGYKPEDFFNDDSDDAKYTRNIEKILGIRKRYIPLSKFVVWDGLDDINKIKKNIQTNFDIKETFHTTRKNTFIAKITNGGKNGSSNIPIKSKTPNGNLFDMKAYGGYESPSYMYMQIFECTNKNGVKTYKLIPINKLYFVDKEKYLKSRFPNLIKIKCVDDNLIINFNSIIENGNLSYRITGVTNNCFVILNNKDRIFKRKDYSTIYAFSKLANKILEKQEITYEIIDDDINAIIYVNKNEHKFVLSGKKLIDLYRTLKEKLLLDVYYYSPSISINNFLNTHINIEKIESKEEFEKVFNLVKELIGYLKTNERKTIDYTKMFTQEELKALNKQNVKLSTKVGVLEISNNLTPGTKIYSYSPTGFYRKLLFEVK